MPTCSTPSWPRSWQQCVRTRRSWQLVTLPHDGAAHFPLAPSGESSRTWSRSSWRSAISSRPRWRAVPSWSRLACPTPRRALPPRGAIRRSSSCSVSRPKSAPRQGSRHLPGRSWPGRVGRSSSVAAGVRPRASRPLPAASGSGRPARSSVPCRTSTASTDARASSSRPRLGGAHSAQVGVEGAVFATPPVVVSRVTPHRRSGRPVRVRRTTSPGVAATARFAEGLADARKRLDRYSSQLEAPAGIAVERQARATLEVYRTLVAGRAGGGGLGRSHPDGITSTDEGDTPA